MTLTADKIKEKLEVDQQWLERGILAIYAKQTPREKSAESTIEDNGVGFNGPDGNYMSYVAKWLKSGKHLSGSHLGKARHKMKKYSAQLLKIAEEKENGRSKAS